MYQKGIDVVSEGEPLLSVKNLSVSFTVYGGEVNAVSDINVDLQRGETLAVVGESGSGKTVTMQAVMGLLDPSVSTVTADEITFSGQSLLACDTKNYNKIRGSKIGMIFQDPMSSLNPTMKVGDQIAEVLQVHQQLSRRNARVKAVSLLQRMGVPDAETRAKQYPFEFSGGMLQRVMIAQSLACKPLLLIADEPTTALDVTIQQQVLVLISDLQKEMNMSVIIVTHDLGVVAQVADRVAVMYAGKIVEYGSVEDIFYRSSHPYTLGLKQALPSFSEKTAEKRLEAIPGSPPDLFKASGGCPFNPRCRLAMSICTRKSPPLYRNVASDSGSTSLNTSDDGGMTVHQSRCWLHHEGVPTEQAKDIHRLVFEGEG